jgi:hypothetical protein
VRLVFKHFSKFCCGFFNFGNCFIHYYIIAYLLIGNGISWKIQLRIVG